MNNLVNSVSQHGYLLIFLVALGEALGLPLPAALAFVAAGAAAAAHILSMPTIFIDAVAAIMIGDTLLFFLGRYTGWALLAGLCRLSLNPETCILRSAESFYKRGRLTLLFAKFIPGINTMAPPLAGSMKMRPFLFLRFDLAGACLYVFVYGLIGYLSRDFVAKLTQRVQSVSHVFTEVVIVAIVVFAIYRIAQFRRYKNTDLVPRVGVEELAQRIASSEEKDVIIADVRSHGYYDRDASRIVGSIRLEPNRLAEEIKTLPKDKDIYIYCT
jgi:membrane protein DedA with SNARE-associated domain